MSAARPIRTVSVVDAVAGALRDEVFADPADTEPMTEAAVALRYEVARPTAKAAIEQLVSEGILVRGPNKTARVPRLGVEDVTDLYRLRTLLEVEAVGSLATTGAVPVEADAVNDRIRALGEVSTPSLVLSDIGFHESLVAAAGSPRLERIYRSIMGEIRLTMAQVQAAHLLDAASIATDHQRITDRIRAGDAAGALTAVRSHLGVTERLLTRHVGEQAAPGSQLAASGR